MFYIPNDFASTIKGYAIIVTLATASGLGSLFGDFVFDDTEAIVNNNDVIGGTPLLNVLQNDFWGTKLTHNHSHKSYRPVTVLSFRLNYIVFGKLVAWGFHVVNLVLHVLVSVMLWTLYSKLLLPHKNSTCFWASCLFAVHPIHTEAVSGIVGRADLLAALFFIFSFLSYTYATTVGKFSGVYLILSIILAGVAMLCKEHGITVLGFNIIYEFLMVQKIDVRKLMRTRISIHVNIKSVFNRTLLRTVVLMLSAAFFVWLRCFLMDFRSPSFQRVDNPASFSDDWFTRTLTLHYIVSLNGWLMVCPDWLCFDWSMGCVALITKATDPRVLLSLLFWFLIIALIFVAVRSSKLSFQREILLSLALLAVPFLPASNLLFRVGFVIAERVLYISSAGYCLLVTIGMQRIITTLKKDLNFTFLLLLLVFLLKSHARSLEWRSEKSLFNSALKVCPSNAKVRYNVAKSAADRGMENEAIVEYREAIRLFPEYDQALNNLANLLKNRGELLEAEKLLRKALKIRVDFPAAWMNLGIVLASRKQYNEAEKAYFSALKLRKFYPDCFYNLGNLYLEEKRFDEAEKAWFQATHQKVNMVIAWNNLIVMNDNRGNLTAAVSIAEMAIAKAGTQPSFHFNLANALGKLGNFTEAEAHFKIALSLEKNNSLYHVNLGVLYHRWKKYELAELQYLEALRINPKMPSAKQNYKMLKNYLSKKNV